MYVAPQLRSFEHFSFVAFALLGSALGCSDSPKQSNADKPATGQPQTPTKSAAEDRAGVQGAFDRYRRAIANSDGQKAAEVMAAATIQEYQNYREWALTADKASLSQQRVDQQRQVLFYRLRLKAEQLEAMDGKALFTHAVNEEWVGKESVAALSLGDIHVAGNRATAKIIVSGKPTTSEFDFVKEGEAWRLDMSRFSKAIGERLAEQVKKTGKTIDEYLLENLSELEGEPVGDKVWLPLK